MFEENVRGTIKEIKQHFTENTLKGEFVIIVAGSDTPAPKKDEKYYKK
jgi:16S rRNA (cytidine1402-2'-O)-methyltransferase